MDESKRGAPSQTRSRARRRLVQALYQWQLTGQPLIDIERQFMDDQDMRHVDLAYFRELLHRIPAECDALDTALAPVLDRGVEQVDPVERAVLRLSAFELLHRPDVPYRVVINEAVELAKVFGAEHGHRYVNGVLDHLARRYREAEWGHD